MKKWIRSCIVLFWIESRRDPEMAWIVGGKEEKVDDETRSPSPSTTSSPSATRLGSVSTMELVERNKESKEERRARKKEQKQARDTTATETTTTTAPEAPVPAPVEQKTGDKNRSTQGNKRRKKKVVR